MTAAAMVTLGAEVGESDPDEVTLAPHYDLRRLVAEYCREVYSPDVDEFAPILRFDGEITHGNLEGCMNLRRVFKDRNEKTPVDGDLN